MASDPRALLADGHARQQAGDLAGALASYDQALAADPAFARAHQDRGALLYHLGRIADALAAFDAAIALRPDWPDPRLNRGAALRRLGRHAEALAAYDDLLKLVPDAAGVRGNRGNVLMDLGRYADALGEFQRAVQALPDSAMAHNNLANALLHLHRPDEALEAVDAALARKPDYATAHYNRGVALMDLERPAEALAAFDAALLLSPKYVEAHNNRGHALLELKRRDEALAAFKTAMALAPDPTDFEVNYRGVLRRLGQVDAALADADRALAQDPKSADGRFSRALALLTLGRFEEGWAEYEHRWDARTFSGSTGQVSPAMRRRLTRWADRADLAGRHVLVAGEQGVGDVVMFASILPDLMDLAAQVTLACEPRLHALMRSSFPTLTVISPPSTAEALDPYDAVLPIGSLARLFRNRLTEFPGAPYLAPDPALRRKWAERLGPREAGRRIGLSWRGGTRATGRTDRSLPLEEIAPALDALGCEIVSLQYGAAADEIAEISGRLDRPIRRFEPEEIDDFADLAALVLELDAVVSVQTALVHLTGALGARGLVLVPFAPEWRYATGTSTMPWYRSVTLLRQGEDRTWPPVIAAVAERLGEPT